MSINFGGFGAAMPQKLWYIAYIGTGF